MGKRRGTPYSVLEEYSTRGGLKVLAIAKRLKGMGQSKSNDFTVLYGNKKKRKIALSILLVGKGVQVRSGMLARFVKKSSRPTECSLYILPMHAT